MQSSAVRLLDSGTFVTLRASRGSRMTVNVPGSNWAWTGRPTRSTIPGSAETCLLVTRLMGWDLDTYQDWLTTTAARLARVAEEDSGSHQHAA